MAATLARPPERELTEQWVHDRLRRDCYAQVTPNLLRLAILAIVDCRMGFEDVTPSKVSFCYSPGATVDVKITVVLWVNRGAVKSAQRYRTVLEETAPGGTRGVRTVDAAEAWITQGGTC